MGTKGGGQSRPSAGRSRERGRERSRYRGGTPAGSGCPAGVVRRVAQQTGPASGPSAAPHPSATVRVEPVTDPATKFVFTPTFRGTEGRPPDHLAPAPRCAGPMRLPWRIICRAVGG